ncbi:sulfotransferase [Pararhodobacter sp. SW119]|uniref:sulfotransferase family protein n=1 Tax=Pararhodobacter sp. SW119 TaxID=2780075 RepID=UPI001AE00496|nr:sulfotransferase [Pararhodobacter sp. SW119]
MPSPPPLPARSEPLFILGCVRSGTTLVRDLLRRQPNVICPEETHYFRYGEPFRTGGHSHPLLNSPTLLKHREIDGIPPEAFRKMLMQSRTRGELLCRHVHHMAGARGLDDYRWFDKTPQNVYGLPLILAEFPKARILHLVRNPLNVVASLKLGKVMKVTDIHGACNYWIEAVTIIRQMRARLNDRLLELRYEDVTADPVASMRTLLAFSGLGTQEGVYSARDAHEERNQYLDILSQEERAKVAQRCAALAADYGYDLR